MKSRRTRTKKCECCGSEFYCQRLDKKTCSKACRKALSRGKTRAPKVERLESVTLIGAKNDYSGMSAGFAEKLKAIDDWLDEQEKLHEQHMKESEERIAKMKKLTEDILARN